MPATEVLSDAVRAATLVAVVGTAVLHVVKRKSFMNTAAAIAWAAFAFWYLFAYYHYGMDFLGVAFCFSFSWLFFLRAFGMRNDWNRPFFRAIFGQRFVDRMDVANERVRRLLGQERDRR